MKRLAIGLLAVLGVLATGCIIQFSSHYKDDAGRTHFVGLASNLSKVDVVDAAVEVRFLDSSGNLLATEYAGPCTRTLPKGKSAPVEAVIPAGVTVDSVETVVHPLTFGAKYEPDLEISNIKLAEDGDTTHLTGDVESSDSKTLRSVRVCGAIFDDDGDVVRVDRVYLDPTTLEDGDVGDFDLQFEDVPGDAEQYQIWVDATTRSPSDVTAPVIEGPEDLPTASTPTPGPTNTPAPTPTNTPTP